MKRYCAAALAFVCFLGTLEIEAQTPSPVLTIASDHFEVDGLPRFLTFVSYFDAMRRANAGGSTAFDNDFAFFRGRVNGIRIMVNWLDPGYSPCCHAADTLIDNGGYVRDAGNWPSSGSGMDPWARFIAVLDAAQAYNLLVDVTFDRDTILPSVPSTATFKSGIYRVIHKLETDYPGKYRNVLFDMQNEWTYSFHGPVSNGDMSDYVTQAKAARSDVIVTGSAESTVSASTAGSNAGTVGFNVVTYHDPRNSNWYQVSTISSLAGSIRGMTSMPIVFDEPMPWQDDSTASHFADAAMNAQLAGVAGWTFHTRSGYDMVAHDYVWYASSTEKASLAHLKASIGFTDPGLSAGYSVKPVHIYELRARINDLRARSNHGPVSWTDTTLVPNSTVVKAAHINELRNALSDAYVWLGQSAPSYAESISAGSPPETVIKASHITELRTKVQYLEGWP
jgi:hypothetical protein